MKSQAGCGVLPFSQDHGSIQGDAGHDYRAGAEHRGRLPALSRPGQVARDRGLRPNRSSDAIPIIGSRPPGSSLSDLHSAERRGY